jgi:hypothetical protein
MVGRRQKEQARRQQTENAPTSIPDPGNALPPGPQPEYEL